MVTPPCRCPGERLGLFSLLAPLPCPDHRAPFLMVWSVGCRTRGSSNPGPGPIPQLFIENTLLSPHYGQKHHIRPLDTKVNKIEPLSWVHTPDEETSTSSEMTWWGFSRKYIWDVPEMLKKSFSCRRARGNFHIWWISKTVSDRWDRMSKDMGCWMHNAQHELLVVTARNKAKRSTSSRLQMAFELLQKSLDFFLKTVEAVHE